MTATGKNRNDRVAAALEKVFAGGVVVRERVGTPFPQIFLCGNGVPVDIFVPVGTAFPLPAFVF